MEPQFFTLYNATAEEEKGQYMKDVVEYLSRAKKSLPQQYLYDEEGSKIFARMNFTKEYYLANCEKEIFNEQGSQILQAIGKEKFNFVELGAGDAEKTKILLRKAAEEGYDFCYIPIDISEDSNKTLAANIQKLSANIRLTILTSTFEEGTSWVCKNKPEKNVFFMVGSTIGSLYNEEAVAYFKWLGGLLKKDDMIVIGLDMKKDPVMIQNAYFSNPEEFPFLLNSIKRINKELGGNFNVDNFYPHSYYNPHDGIVRGCLVSKQEQKVNIGDKEFVFEEAEVMEITHSKKWLQKDIDELMSVANTTPVASFDDSKRYFREIVYRKE